VNWTVAKPWVGMVARLLLGVVWIWAALAKLAHPLLFVQTVRAYDLSWEWLAKAIGYGLPVLELCLGIVLVVGVTVRIAAAVSAVLFVVFLIALSVAAARGLSVTCGCFTAGKITQSGASHTLEILMVIGLLIASAYLVLWAMTRFSVEEFLARHDYVEVPSAKRMRTTEGRRRYETRLAEVQKNARSRNLYLTALICSVVVLVSVIGIGVQATRAKISNVIAGTFANATDGVIFGKKAAATVEIYEDFACTACRVFAQATASRLENEVRANLAEVRYHPIAVLDSESPNQYSSRAANAAVCASDQGDDAFVTYHDALFGTLGKAPVQPAPGQAGPNNSKLVALAGPLKLKTSDEATLRNCVFSQNYAPLVRQLTDTASKRGIAGPFAVFVNGSRLSDPTPAALFAAIAAADKNGPPPQPSTTPTTPPPSPSTSLTPSGTPSSPTGSSPSATPSSSASSSRTTSASSTPPA
jgi:protein-disulfide isomerase/uncharacterized membrane protein YphA (DoxX/SURF4 family)